MIIVKLAIRNLLRNLRKNTAIGIVVAFGIGAMMFGNAVFEGTEAGMRGSFAESFTGDLAIRSEYFESFSLFGNQTPIIGGMAEIPIIAQYEDIRAGLASREEIESFTSVVSGFMVLESGSYQKPVCVFGVSGDEYFQFFQKVKITEGKALASGEPGIILTESRIEQITAANGRRPRIGDSILLSLYSSVGFSLKEVPLRGISVYPIRNDALDSIVIADAGTVRDILGMRGKAENEIVLADSATNLLGSDLDALFEGSDDIAASDEGVSLSAIEKSMDKIGDGSVSNTRDSGGWTHILLRLKPNVSRGDTLRRLNADFMARVYQAKAENWRDTAGSSAQFVLWLRIIFNIGFVIVAVAGIFIIVNTLVILVIERTKEIGTMRALGASPRFVRNLLFIETTMLTSFAGLIGIALALAAIAIVGRSGIALNNQLLSTLFGSSILRPNASLIGIFEHAGISMGLGIVSSAYPVGLALKVKPIRALASE